LGTRQITGRYVGPNKRPSPTAEKAAKQAAQEEADRFKHVTEPAKGVPTAAIAGELHEMKQVYEIGGLQLREQSYLLLNDGTAYEDLRCPPHQLDLAASRRFEPRSWGRWRRSGGKIELQFPRDDGRQGECSVPSMASMARPGTQGERLGARFEAWSVSGPNFGGGSSRKSNNPKANRMGNYQIDGYALVLRYDSGKIERLPFFLVQDDRSEIWFRGSSYSLPSEN
jgi:hypothetical protein